VPRHDPDAAFAALAAELGLFVMVSPDGYWSLHSLARRVELCEAHELMVGGRTDVPLLDATSGFHKAVAGFARRPFDGREAPAGEVYAYLAAHPEAFGADWPPAAPDFLPQPQKVSTKKAPAPLTPPSAAEINRRYALRLPRGAAEAG
jgi:hypothetical protein